MSLRLITVFLLSCAITAFAESTDCTTPVLILADGRLTQSSFPQNTTYWYGIYAQAGHSYSAEFEPPADNYLNATRVQFTTLGVFGPTDHLQACRGASSVTVTQNSGYAPVILKSGNGAGRRVSFTAQSAGLHLISVTNVAGTGSYTFRAVDTTLFNARWNTMSAYDAQWTVMNVSDMTLSGTITLIDLSGNVITAVSFNIPAGGRVARSSGSSDFNLPRNLAGSAIFSHNGPPNSVLAEATLSNGTTVLVLKFETVGSR